MCHSRQGGVEPQQPFAEPPRGLVLASKSPRRRRLLEWLGLSFSVTEVDTIESLDTPLASDPPALAASLAAEKAGAARDLGLTQQGLVLCFDTIVVLDDEVLGKPCDVDDAWRMLRALSGRVHEVVTGIALLAPGADDPRTLAVTTAVTMRALTDADIEEWMRSGTFMGCAGAYNIEAQIAEVSADECYQNVAGLPLCHLFAELRDDPTLAAYLPGDAQCPAPTCDAALGRTCRLAPRVTRTTWAAG
jgi:septum formation protein